MTLRNFAFLILAILLSSCSGTLNLRHANDSSKSLDLSKYDYVIINDFDGCDDCISKSSNGTTIKIEGQKFADAVASSIKEKKLFSKVERNINSTNAALLIDGTITKHDEGCALRRFMIGYTAGRSYFSAKINIKDNQTKELLDSIDIDIKSSPLGGVIGASQNVTKHMRYAAKKIACKCEIAMKRAH